MKRKVIQLAGRTHVISLPSKWVKKYGIKKGDEVELQEANDNLIINTTSELATRKTTIDITGFNTRLIWHAIVSAYVKGDEEIEIHFNNTTTLDPLTNKTCKTIETISQIIDNLIGIEIIRHGKNHCVLKEITKAKYEEYENVLRRIFLILSIEAADILEAAKTKDNTIKENIKYSEANINKLCNYSLRLLNKKIYNSHLQTIMHYRTITNLEEIGDIYAKLAENIIKNSINTNILAKTNKLLEMLCEIHYTPNKEQIIKAYDLRHSIKESLKKQKNKQANDIIRITDKIMDVLHYSTSKS